MRTVLQRDIDNAVELGKIADKLVQGLMDETIFPCADVMGNRSDEQNCILTEQARPLTAKERQRHGTGWSQRPQYAYDTQRLCASCLAYWYAAQTAGAVNDLVCRLLWLQRRGQEQQAIRQQPQPAPVAPPDPRPTQPAD